MASKRRATHLQKLLNLCDDLGRLHARMHDPELRGDARTRMRRQSKRKVMQLGRDLASYRYRGPLATAMRQHRFGADHFLLLGHLLHRYLRSADPCVEGRVLLGMVFESSFEVLAGMELLRPESPLRLSGLVVLDDDEEQPDDLLEARFRISEEAVLAFRGEVDGLVPEDLRQQGIDRYHGNRQFLIDLRILHNLYQERSERVFHPDRWGRLHDSPLAPGRGLTRRIDAMWQRVRGRLDRTENRGRLPAVRFMLEHMLTEQEMVVVVHLLFKELYEGAAHADVAELLRLVCADENELIESRRLMAVHGALRRAEILHVEPLLENREFTGEAHLNDWVVQAMFGPTEGMERRIGADERLDWHLYLRELRESEAFFRDLEAN